MSTIYAEISKLTMKKIQDGKILLSFPNAMIKGLPSRFIYIDVEDFAKENLIEYLDSLEINWQEIDA